MPPDQLRFLKSLDHLRRYFASTLRRRTNSADQAGAGQRRTVGHTLAMDPLWSRHCLRATARSQLQALCSITIRIACSRIASEDRAVGFLLVSPVVQTMHLPASLARLI
jgi:hypothetical protein